MSEQKIIFEGDGDGRDVNGAKYFSSLFHFWYYNHIIIFFLFLLARAYHVKFQLVKKNISGCDFVIPHVDGKNSM